VDLSLVLDDELWEEIKKRFDGAILTTVRDINGKHEAIQISFCGGKAQAIGLAERTRDKILSDMRNDEEPHK